MTDTPKYRIVNFLDKDGFNSYKVQSLSTYHGALAITTWRDEDDLYWETSDAAKEHIDKILALTEPEEYP